MRKRSSLISCTRCGPNEGFSTGLKAAEARRARGALEFCWLFWFAKGAGGGPYESLARRKPLCSTTDRRDP
jgi:hypothetical protein